MDDFYLPPTFPISSGDQAHLAAASREPAHRAALHRRIQDQQISTRALLDTAGGDSTVTASHRPKPFLVPRPRSNGERNRPF
jgi:hypothetical protein